MIQLDTTEPIDVRVARRLRGARLAAGLTVREAATQIGLDDHSIIVRYENGSARPPLDRLSRLASCYGLTAAALLASNDALVPLITALEQSDAQLWAAVAALLAPAR
jgi:transcriptional regulator with XRE-family HTH domain